jgi:hypothetical protein
MLMPQEQQNREPVVVERVQTGVRMEKRLLKVLKAVAELKEITLGDLLFSANAEGDRTVQFTLWNDAESRRQPQVEGAQTLEGRFAPSSRARQFS